MLLYLWDYNFLNPSGCKKGRRQSRNSPWIGGLRGRCDINVNHPSSAEGTSHADGNSTRRGKRRSPGWSDKHSALCLRSWVVSRSAWGRVTAGKSSAHWDQWGKPEHASARRPSWYLRFGPSAIMPEEGAQENKPTNHRCMYAQVYIYIYMIYVYVHIYKERQRDIYIYTCIYVPICICILLNISIYIHMYIRTYYLT